MKMKTYPYNKVSLSTNYILILFLAFFLFQNANAQVTIFSEDFEAASTDGNAENLASPYLNWQNAFFNTTPPTNDNFFWIFDNTRCPVIDVVETPTDVPSNYSMAVSQNNPATTGTLPQYRDNRVASTLVYHTNPIDATNYTNLTLDFNWICEGEILAGLAFDYGTVLYSLDANTWTVLPDIYVGQNTVQNVTNLDISVLDGQTFYLGFGWNNDNSFGNSPSFVIDDIFVKGTILPNCTTPAAQPTGLNVSSAGDTINGNFTDAAPVPDNYLVVVSTNNTPPTPIDGTTYNVGDLVGAGYTVVDNDNNTLFTATGLNANTVYYIYVFSYNSQCLGGPNYNIINPLNGSISTTNSSYCTPSSLVSTTFKYIEDVEFIGNLINDSNYGNGTSASSAGYSDYSNRAIRTTQAQGEGVNIYVGSSTGRGLWKAWVDWNKDGDFTDANEQVYDTNGIATTTTTFGFVIPANQPIGDYRIRIRFYSALVDYNGPGNSCDGFYEVLSDPQGNFDSCTPFSIFTNSFDPPCGPSRNSDWYEFGEAEDYLFTVVESCTAQIASIADGVTCGPGPVTLQVTGNANATTYNLYDAESGGNLIASNTTGVFTPNITDTTEFWVTASDGNCETLRRLKIIGTLNPTSNLTINSSSSICGEDDIIEISATGDTEQAYLIDEDFESGGLGVFTVNNLANNQNADTQWQNRTSTYVPSTQPAYQVWFPAISSGFGTNNFVMATSDVPNVAITETALESPTVDSSTFTNLTLEFDIYFSRYLFDPFIPEDVQIQVSTNGGANWNTITTYDNDLGFGTDFFHVSLNLDGYINEANLRIRIKYYANYWCDGVAVDNIQLYGQRPLTPSFTWSAGVDAYTDAAATTPYIAGNVATTVYVKPSLTQLEQVDFNFTAFATLSNGCVVNRPIVITNNTKIWNGTQGDSDWYDPDNWYPNGVPTADNCVIIRDRTTTGGFSPNLIGTPPVPPTALAYNMTVKNGGIFELSSDRSLVVTNAIDVEMGGLFYIKNNGSLVQLDDVANSGDFFVERAPANGGAIDNQNYVYWSSPVNSFNLDNVSPGTANTLKWRWETSIAGNGAGNHGNWLNATGETMLDGKGYIVRGLSGVMPNPTISLTANSALFEGQANNGTVTIPLLHGNYNGADYTSPSGGTATNNDDNWNLVGNPYPSSISAYAFIDENAGIIDDDDTPPLIGAVWLWPHAELPSQANVDPFYEDYVYNYASNYIKVNKTGSTIAGSAGDLFIASGQAFFVLAEHSANPSGSDVVEFNNSMRDESYSNSNFFRNGNDESTETKDTRVWLDLINPTGSSMTILIGYVNGATNEKDRLFDAPELEGANFSFYSLLQNDKCAIQGKELPFEDSDFVKLGYKAQTTGNYTIAIGALDGILNEGDKNVYLEDASNGILHNLKLSPYSFETQAGTFNDRFILRYIEDTLSINQYENDSDLLIYTENNLVKLKSENNLIDSVSVYDVLGRIILDIKNINAHEKVLLGLKPSESTLIVKTKLTDGRQKIQKIIY